MKWYGATVFQDSTAYTHWTATWYSYEPDQTNGYFKVDMMSSNVNVWMQDFTHLSGCATTDVTKSHFTATTVWELVRYTHTTSEPNSTGDTTVYYWYECRKLEMKKLETYKKTGNVLGTVTSYNQNAYPTSGKQGDYFYVLNT